MCGKALVNTIAKALSTSTALGLTKGYFVIGTMLRIFTGQFISGLL